MIDKPLQQFLDDLASRSATPGGGSATAIIGAMGAALVSMVCNLTLGKAGYESVASEMSDTLAEAENLRARLADMVRQDIDAFDRVMACYAMPKLTDEQKHVRSAAIQDALKLATDVPLACARLCADLIRLCRIATQHGNRNVISDAGVGVMAAYAAMKSAALNVYVNVGSIKDESFTAARVAEIERLLAECERDTAEVFADVRSRL
ncbi:MAG: cyclodeaminase/cyclohydrolase family protein [Methylotetracoccus sp.]